MSRKAAESVERFDPEGGKSPGGEWRQRKQPSEPGEKNRNGPEASNVPSSGANYLEVRSRRRTGRGHELAGREVAGRDF